MAAARGDIGERRLRALRDAAERARRTNYRRYSNFLVLAAAETANGVFGGSNIEIANYTLTKHAEETALLAAISAGAGPRGAWLRALYVVGGAPCGSCRQFAYEFADDETLVVVDEVPQADLRTKSLLELAPRLTPQVWKLSALLPAAFGPRDLEQPR